MKTRIITAIVALIIFVPVLIFADTTLFASVTLINLALALLSAVGALEAIKCIGEKNRFVILTCTASAFLLPLFTTASLGFYTPVFIALLFILLFAGVVKNKSLTCTNILNATSLIFYVTVSFGAIAVIYNTDVRVFPLIFIGAWVTDTFAYFSGYFFGKHKLIEAISPKKTVEGAVGGSLATTLVFALYAYFMTNNITTTLVFALVGLIASIVSQFGDLAASLVKRSWGIKDFGSLFPGHGGVLDRFDSILAVSAFLYIVILFTRL